MKDRSRRNFLAGVGSLLTAEPTAAEGGKRGWQEDGGGWDVDCHLRTRVISRPATAAGRCVHSIPPGRPRSPSRALAGKHGLPGSARQILAAAGLWPLPGEDSVAG